jgi:hypothetical protein
MLREEARLFLSDTGLFALLEARWGTPSVTGSASYDLMVSRGIDIHTAVEADRWREWMAFGGEIAELLNETGLVLHKAAFINDYVDPETLGAGLYWGLETRDFAGNAWKIDLWGWDPFDHAVRQARDFSLRTDLAACDRDLILRLKTEARERGAHYGARITSWDIYQFALAEAGDSLEALEQWLAER